MQEGVESLLIEQDITLTDNLINAKQQQYEI